MRNQALSLDHRRIHIGFVSSPTGVAAFDSRLLFLDKQLCKIEFLLTWLVHLLAIVR